MAKRTPVKKAFVKKAVVKHEPQEDALSPKEAKALDDAVAYINGRMNTASVSVIEIGQYLLKHFFGDDPSKASDRGSRKGLSLRKLAEHPDLTLTYSALSRAVSVAVQEKQLSTVATLQHTTASHKILLLNIDDSGGMDEKKALELKKKYLAQIEKEQLSVRKFRDLLEADGYVKQRGLGAIESEAERKLLRSGFHKLIDPFESIVELDLKRLLELPSTNLKSAYDAAKKARMRLDAIITGIEARLKS